MSETPTPPVPPRRQRRRGVIIGLAAALALVLVAATQVSIFVVQPIGAAPEGRTLIISRLTNVHFVDSADGICGRLQGGVSLLCRGAVLGRVASEAHIYARLPYSSALYGLSTGGRAYDR